MQLNFDNYQKIPNAEVVAIADVNQAEAERVGSLYGVPNVYTDFRQLLAGDFQIVFKVGMRRLMCGANAAR